MVPELQTGGLRLLFDLTDWSGLINPSEDSSLLKAFSLQRASLLRQSAAHSLKNEFQFDLISSWFSRWASRQIPALNITDGKSSFHRRAENYSRIQFSVHSVWMTLGCQRKSVTHKAPCHQHMVTYGLSEITVSDPYLWRPAMQNMFCTLSCIFKTTDLSSLVSK